MQSQKDLIIHSIFETLEVMAALRYGFAKWSVSAIDQGIPFIKNPIKWAIYWTDCDSQ